MTNTAAIKLGNEISSNSLALADRMSNLNSGTRIQSASDDSANLQISNRLNSASRGFQVAIRNANDGISIMQTAEGAMQESTNILQRMRDLSIQSANATNQLSDRKALNDEFLQLKSELNRIAEQTSFGGQTLLNGNFGVQSFQVGADANELITVSLNSVAAKDLQLHSFQASGKAMSDLHIGTSLDNATTNLSLNGFGNGGVGPGQDTVTIKGLQENSIQIASSDSANEIASKINAIFSTTGVQANASTEVELHIHSGTAGNTVAFEKGEQVSFDIGNGKDVATLSFTATGDYSNDLEKLANKVNEQAAALGIGATRNTANDSLILTSVSGDNISISNYNESSEAVNNQIEIVALDFDGATGTNTTLQNDGGAAIIRGNLSLTTSSGDGFSVSSNVDFGLFNNGLGSSGEVRQSATSTLESSDILSAKNAQNAISVIDASLAKVDKARSTAGSISSRLSSAINNLANVHENTENSLSNLRDTDYSKEAAELAKLQVTQQASTAILSQANTLPEQAITLLG